MPTPAEYKLHSQESKPGASQDRYHRITSIKYQLHGHPGGDYYDIFPNATREAVKRDYNSGLASTYVWWPPNSVSVWLDHNWENALQYNLQPHPLIQSKT